MRTILTSCFLFFLCIENAAAIRISDFLANAEKDPRVIQKDHAANFIKNAPTNTPFLERIEFRTETDSFDLSNQKYSVRFYPKSLGEMRYEKEIHKAGYESEMLERSIMLHQALKQRYLIVAQQYHNVRLMELKRKMESVHQDRVNVLKEISNRPDFDVNDLISAQNDLTGIQLEIIESEGRNNAVSAQIKILSPGNSALEFTGITNIDQIENIIRTLPLISENDHVYLNAAKQNILLAENRHVLKKAENGKIIDFFNITYDNEQHEDMGEAFFIEFGIRLPFVKSDMNEINKAGLDILKEKSALEDLKRELLEKQNLISAELNILIHQYRTLKEKAESSGARPALDLYAGMEGVNPLTLLKIRHRIIESETAIEKIRNEIFLKYIDLLDISGRLSEKPLKNYLSVKTEVIVQ